MRGVWGCSLRATSLLFSRVNSGDDGESEDGWMDVGGREREEMGKEQRVSK